MDIVLRNVLATNAAQKLRAKHGKLATKWEGPYFIEEDFGNGIYTMSKLKNDKKVHLKNKCNVNNLKKFHVSVSTTN